MAARIEWNGEEMVAAMRKAVFAGVLKAGAYLQRDIKELLNKSGRAKGGGARSPTSKGTRPMKVYHSRPGEAPFADTGKLRQSIFMSPDEMTTSVRVGTVSWVGVYMEKGVHGGKEIVPVNKKCLVFPGWVTAKAKGKKGERSEWGWMFSKRVIQGSIAPRPWLVPSVVLRQQRLRDIIIDEAHRRMATLKLVGGINISMGVTIGMEKS